MTTDANLTSDNQPTQPYHCADHDHYVESCYNCNVFKGKPTQSFDEKLEAILDDYHVPVEFVNGIIREFKAAIVEARPERDLVPGQGQTVYNAALDEWSKNLGIQ